MSYWLLEETLSIMRNSSTTTETTATIAFIDRHTWGNACDKSNNDIDTEGKK